MSSEFDLAEVLSEFASTMVTDFAIQGILDRLMRQIVHLLPVGAAGVTLVTPDGGPEYVAASGDKGLRFEQLQTELGAGPCLLSHATGEAVVIGDLRHESRFPTYARRALQAGAAAVFTFPLRHGGTQLGALNLYGETTGQLSPAAMAAAQTLADVAAAYLINAQARADLQHSSDQSRHAALHDGLTGLPNRVLMLERLEHAVLRGRSSCRPPAVLYVDLDSFRKINDLYGHRTGDELLVAVAERLTGLLRPGDTLSRLSGDEFVIICEDAGTPTQAEVIALRLRAALARPFVLSDSVLSITASIGIAYADRLNVAPEHVLQDADLAMYRAKRTVSGARLHHDQREQHLADHQAGLERNLDEAVGRGELHLEYQPVVAAANGQVAGVEALLRWQHPSRGLVSPNVFIPMAEQAGIITGIGHWVLEQAWTDRRRWRPLLGADDFAVAVNVSAHQFMSPGFVDSVEAVLASGSSEPALLTLEITEGVFVRDGQRALVVLHDLKAHGVRIALDDFGTGYSSLSSLMGFPVDNVKIDRELIANLGRDRASRTLVASVIQLAHDLDMTVTAEGVETAEQFHELRRLGCDFCQGYYFARPQPAAAIDLHMQVNAAQPEQSLLTTLHDPWA